MPDLRERSDPVAEHPRAQHRHVEALAVVRGDPVERPQVLVQFPQHLALRREEVELPDVDLEHPRLRLPENLDRHADDDVEVAREARRLDVQDADARLLRVEEDLFAGRLRRDALPPEVAAVGGIDLKALLALAPSVLRGIRSARAAKSLFPEPLIVLFHWHEAIYATCLFKSSQVAMNSHRTPRHPCLKLRAVELQLRTVHGVERH